jgi:hypothetical protein
MPDTNPDVPQEALTLRPNRARCVESLKFDANEILHFALARSDQEVI